MLWRKLLFLIGSVFLLATAASAQTVAVTGNLKDLGVNNITSPNSYVQFTLQNYGSNIPRVIGSNAIVSAQSPPFLPNSSGNISGSIQANDSITPANTFYRVCVYNQGTQFQCNNFSILTSPGTFNLNTATPLSIVPGPAITNYVVTNPSGIQNISGFALGVPLLTLGSYTIAGLPPPATVPVGALATAINGLASGDCTIGGGSSITLCRNNGTAWQPEGGSGGGGGGSGPPFLGPNPWFDITNTAFAGGAKCDGVTDDTNAIEAARAAAVASSGGTIFFPPNTSNTACVYNPPTYGNPANVITFLVEAPVIVKATWHLSNFYHLIGNPTGISASGNPNFRGAIPQVSITPSPSSISPVILDDDQAVGLIANVAVIGYTGNGIYIDKSANTVLSNVLSDGSAGTSSTCALTLNSSFGYKVIDGTYEGSLAGVGTGGSICITSTHFSDPPRLINIFGSGPSSSITLRNKGIHMSASADQSGPAATNINMWAFLTEALTESLWTIDNSNALSLRKFRLYNGSTSDGAGGPFPLITCVNTVNFQDITVDGIDGVGSTVFSSFCDGRVGNVLVNGVIGSGVGLSSNYVSINNDTSSLRTSRGIQIGIYDDRSTSFTYLIDTPDYVAQCGNNTNFMLPDATLYVNQIFNVKRDHGTTGTTLPCTMTTFIGGQTIDGLSSYTLTNVDSWAMFFSDGANWRVLSASNPKPLIGGANIWTGAQTFQDLVAATFPEIASPGGTSAATVWSANSTSHWPIFNPNNTGDFRVAGFTGTITSGHCPQINDTKGGMIDSGSSCGSGGTGSVTSFSVAADPIPIFTTSVANPGTTPALSFALSTALANKVFANCTGSTATPSYQSLTEGCLPSATVFTDQDATFGAHNYDFSGATTFKIKTGAGYAPTTDGLSGFNTTTHLPVWGFNSASTTTIPVSVTCGSHQWMSSYAQATGALSCSQLAFADLSTASNGVNAQSGAGYTLLAGDSGKLVSVSNASAETLTLPGTVPAAGWWVDVENTGAGTWTSARNGHNIDGGTTNFALTTNQGIRIFSDGSNYFTQRGVGGSSGSGPTLQTNGSNNASQTALNFTDSVGASGIHFTNPGTSTESAALASTTGGGNAVAQMTATNPQPGDYVTYNSAGILVNQTPGVTPNVRTCSGYTILSSDRGKPIFCTDGGAAAVTLPQAGTSGFGTNFYFCIRASGAGTVTVTPTTSTINGNSNQAISTTRSACVYSDNTNYFAVTIAGY